jgi:pyruvate kinase
MSEALNAIDQVLDLHCAVTITETGHSAKLAAAERPSVPIMAITENRSVYHQLNLAWGVCPLIS